MDVLSEAYAAECDRADELAGFREAFVIEPAGPLYLDGNSLGRLPRRAAERLRETAEQEWGRRLIRGWNDGWFTAAQRLGAKLAPLLGAQPDEVLVSDSTSINLFKLTVAALQAQAGRRGVVTDNLNFPTDLYGLQGVIALLNAGHTLTVAPSPDGLTGPEAALTQALTSDTALLSLSHVAFKSGFQYDLAAVTARAHQAGALVLWDLSHSAGAVPLDLTAAGADLAVGCTYKYLNGGPGAPAFLYVRRALQEQLHNPIWGWFGQRDQFAMAPDYAPAAGLGRFLVGTPPVLALAAVEAGLDLLAEAGVARVRAKSVTQTEYLITLWEAWLRPLGVTLNSPRHPAQRGSHLAFGHPDGLRVARALIETQNVIPDFRYPDNLRFGVTPLYTTFAELREAMRRFQRVLVERQYLAYPADRPAVT